MPRCRYESARSLTKRGSGKVRSLGIPALRDRIIQMAAKLVLEPIFEADFCPTSFGFRPGRRAQDAIEETRRFINPPGRYEWVIEGDVENCFGALHHGLLMEQVRGRVTDKRVLALIRKFLAAGVMSELGTVTVSPSGTPQGAILSPLLANVALSVLDRHFEETWRAYGAAPRRARLRAKGHATYRLVRYADDSVPRTLKEVRCRRRYRRMRCCTRDEGAGLSVWWPFAAALQGEAANHREVRRSRAGVLSVAEKARCQRVRCGSRRRAKAIPPLKCRKRIGGIQNRGRVVAPG